MGPPKLGPVLSTAELRRRANAACASTSAKLAALARPSDFDTNAKAAQAYLTKVIAVREAEASGLHLNAPDQIRGAYIRFFGNLLRAQLQLVLAANAISTGSRSYPASYARAVDYEHKVVAPMARQLGLTSCPG